MTVYGGCCIVALQFHLIVLRGSKLVQNEVLTGVVGHMRCLLQVFFFVCSAPYEMWENLFCYRTAW
jgi:hypothetical protein